MVKFTRIELTEDDPIFRGGAQVFKPVSRPSPKPELPPLTKEQSEVAIRFARRMGADSEAEVDEIVKTVEQDPMRGALLALEEANLALRPDRDEEKE